ncbi:hypothetical protein C8034_v011596 [Colletotrichum sidae]|uniref:FAD-binding PCMH-type domain-containing protein n=1 Tax=Colletotrichum sidae TaxID=1347389 RepID=A0A4R8T0P3_9PEZI|nr:hypothetical protein C8034_v011596 [Colletotrichum sidae]
MASSLKTPRQTAWTHPVHDRLRDIIKSLEKSSDFSKRSVPGLKDLLKAHVDPDVNDTSIDFLRGLLRVFKDSETDGAYSDTLKRHTADEQQRIEKFVAGGKVKDVGRDFEMGPSLGFREEMRHMLNASHVLSVGADGVKAHRQPSLLASAVQGVFTPVVTLLEAFAQKVKSDFEGDLLVYYNTKFQNWGRTVENTPYITCVPKTVKEIELIVRFAKEHDMGVRCSGYRHSWSPVFSRDGPGKTILISFVGLWSATVIPNTDSIPFFPFGEDPVPTELESIEIMSRMAPGGNYLVRVGAGCTNERLRQWCVDNKRVTLPLNVIMVEITLGGSNAPICHGAGRRHKTLSDLVRKIEYVDANGVSRTVSDPAHLRAASGAFGLIGVVTHITFEMPPMTYAKLAPQKLPVTHAIPPPPDMPDSEIPPALRGAWTTLSAAEKARHQQAFEQMATDDFYCEWFWFPYTDQVWINSWNDTTDPAGVVNYPSNPEIFVQFLQTFTMNVLQYAPVLPELVELSGISEAAVTLISHFALKEMPTDEVKTYLPDALHFRRGIQNVRVHDVEVEIPLVAKHDGFRNRTVKSAVEIDYAPVQRAWWDAILLVYKHSDQPPMSMPLEMRIMGGSDVVMAPQRGNALGTCAIEVLTLQATHPQVWSSFAQEVIDRWTSLEDPNTGLPLKVRPHWAKEWKGYNVGGRPWFEKLKNDDYKEEIRKFLDVMEQIGEGHGWTLKDLKKRFSNEMFDELMFSGLGQTQAKPRTSPNALSASNSNKLPSKVQTKVVELDVENMALV